MLLVCLQTIFSLQNLGLSKHLYGWEKSGFEKLLKKKKKYNFRSANIRPKESLQRLMFLFMIHFISTPQLTLTPPPNAKKRRGGPFLYSSWLFLLDTLFTLTTLISITTFPLYFFFIYFLFACLHLCSVQGLGWAVSAWSAQPTLSLPWKLWFYFQALLWSRVAYAIENSTYEQKESGVFLKLGIIEDY